MADRKPQGYVFGEFRVDLHAYQLQKHEHQVSLTPKVFDTLALLVRHRDRTVGKDELMNEIWPDSFVSEDNLTQAISVLRRALGDEANQPRYIATVARQGYRFIAPVREVYDAEAEGLPMPSMPVESPPQTATRSAPRTARNRWLAAAALTVAAVGGTLLARNMPARAVPSRGALRFSQEAPEGTTLSSGGTLSPDGQRLAFIAQDERTGRETIWVRELDAAQPRSITDTDNAARPFWSPDGRSIGFFDGANLKRIELDGQHARVIVPVGPNAEGGAWSAGGVIIFAAGRSGLVSVPAEGGAPSQVTTLDMSKRDVRHAWPQLLPDGESFLFFIDSPNPGRTGTYVGRLGSTQIDRLLDVPAIYGSGQLLYVRDRILSAVAFDVTSHRMGGSPSMLAANVVAPAIGSEASVSVSRDGLLAFTASKDAEHLESFSAEGDRLGILDATVALRNPVFLADPRRLLAASNGDADHKGLWMIDIDRGALTRVASDGMRPFPSPTGTDVAFTSDRSAGVADIYVRKLSAVDGDDQPLVHSNENKFVCDWSADGGYLVYGSTGSAKKTDLWAISLRDHRPRRLFQSTANEVCGEISPDGRWLAYASDESGGWQVYVDAFPQGGRKEAISSHGGAEPHWSRNGRQLFFLGSDRTLMRVEVNPGTDWRASAPRAMFRLPLSAINPYINQYAVSPDGQRLVVHVTANTGRQHAPITVVVNWPALIKP
jgi:eukaryotic-like serine/threonine-protein kinase